MTGVGNLHEAVLNTEEGSRRNATVGPHVNSVPLETEETLGALPMTNVAWIPVMEQVLEFEVVEKPENKAGKMKARARAKAKQKPAAAISVECVVPTPPPARKSQRARQPPAKFRYLVPRALGQHSLHPMAPPFRHPPSSNGLPPLPLVHNLMLPPFPSTPISTPLGNSSLPSPSTAAAPLHLSTFARVNDQSLQPSSVLAATPTFAVPPGGVASVERRRSSVSNKRSAARKKLSSRPYEEHARQSSFSHSRKDPSETVSRTSVESASATETTVRAGVSSAVSTGSPAANASAVASSSQWSNAVQVPQSCFRPYVGNSYQTSIPSVEAGAATRPQGRSAKKPPRPPNPWYRKSVGQNLPYPPPAILKRSFAHVPPPPTCESHPAVPPRASLNNRDLRFPKAAVAPFSPSPGKSPVAQTTASPHSVPWLMPPQQDTSQCRIPVFSSSGHTNGTSVPGQTPSQQKRRMRQLKNGIGKKLQNLVQGAKLVQEPDGQRQGVPTLKQIVLTDEQRMKLVNDMIEACRSDPRFRAKYLDAVKQLSYFGVLQTASYQLVAQGPSKAAQELVDTWKDQPPPTQGGSTSASIKFYRAVNKVHEEGVEIIGKLPSLKEANTCSVSKRNDGAWVVTLPDEKKRKINCEERPPINVS